MAFFDSFFKSKGGSVVGVDIGSSSLKVVQLRREGGKAILETYGELALGPYAGAQVGQATNLAPDQVGGSLVDLLREAKVTTRSAGVSIPFGRSLLTLVELPYRANDAEQKTVIQLEARKYIPVPASEVQLDWFIVPDTGPAAERERKTRVQVLLVAVHNDELAQLAQSVRDAGLLASFYEIEIFSTIRAVIDEPTRPVLILDIGAGTTKLYVIEHGIVAYSHSISKGSQDITRAIAASSNVSIARAEAVKREEGLTGGAASSLDLVLSQIFSEAHRALVQYETEQSKSVAAVVLTGGGAVTKDLSGYAKKIFAVDVRVADPFAKTEAPAFMRPVLEKIGPEFAVAVGLALRKLDEA